MPLTYYIVFSMLMALCVLFASKPGTTGVLIKLLAIAHIALSLWTLHKEHNLVKVAEDVVHELPTIKIEK